MVRLVAVAGCGRGEGEEGGEVASSWDGCGRGGWRQRLLRLLPLPLLLRRGAVRTREGRLERLRQRLGRGRRGGRRGGGGRGRGWRSLSGRSGRRGCGVEQARRRGRGGRSDGGGGRRGGGRHGRAGHGRGRSGADGHGHAGRGSHCLLGSLKVELACRLRLLRAAAGVAGDGRVRRREGCQRLLILRVGGEPGRKAVWMAVHRVIGRGLSGVRHGRHRLQRVVRGWGLPSSKGGSRRCPAGKVQRGVGRAVWVVQSRIHGGQQHGNRRTGGSDDAGRL